MPPLSSYKNRDTCRACGRRELRPFLSLGPTPLANAFLRSPKDFSGEAFYPLDVYYCETCSLVQLLHVIDPETLFRDYIYVTGTSATIAAHNVDYARAVVELLKLQANDLVVEIASNDGSLLKCFKQCGVRMLGIEPALNIAKMANENGIETIAQFFNSSTAEQLRLERGPAKVVIGNNVLAHVDEPRDFLRGCRELLDDDGLVVMEVPYLPDLLDKLEYDTIYHEHLCYFSVNSLRQLCDRAGLSILRIDHVSVHGGSIRMYAGRPERYGSQAAAVDSWAKKESALGLTSFARFDGFATEVEANRRDLLDLLNSLRSRGQAIAGYGAPAKSTTLLNYCGIDTSLIAYTVDKNPLKVGLYSPGVHIPVLPVSTLLDRQPDFVMILAWNFAEEIMNQQKAYAARGGRFIVPIPKPQVVSL